MTNEDINIRVEAEGAERAIMSDAPTAETLLGINNESIVVRSISDYEQLDNLPQINDVTLIGNKSFEDLGAESLTNLEIEAIINSVA